MTRITRSPISVRVRRAARAIRLACWFVGAAVAGSVMWLGAALFGNNTANATPATTHSSTANRPKPNPSTTGAKAHQTGPATPASAAPPANLAPESVWDRVAKCESGGRWNINTGNGYHGGLQFKPSTWRAFGGTKYAPTANKATKAQQIEIAKKVLAKQGPGAWPVCGKKAGLTKAHAKTSEKEEKAEKTQKKTESKKTKSKQKQDHKTTKHKDDHGKHKFKSSQDKPKDGKIVVARGDTLSELAKKHKVPGGWQKLFEENRERLSDPNKILPGQELTLPKA